MTNTTATGWTFAQVPIWLLCNEDVSDGANKALRAKLAPINKRLLIEDRGKQWSGA